jgi:hypothetical protein
MMMPPPFSRLNVVDIRMQAFSVSAGGSLGGNLISE